MTESLRAVFDSLPVKRLCPRRRRKPKPGLSVHDATSPIFCAAIGKRAPSSHSHFTVLHRFIPRRIDLDCDYALDSLVSQNPHITARLPPCHNGHSAPAEQQQQQLARQQRRAQRRANHQAQTTSSRKTLELLEHFMPQNRRIYNFGVKTLKPRPIGTDSPFHLALRSLSLFRSQ